MRDDLRPERIAALLGVAIELVGGATSPAPNACDPVRSRPCFIHTRVSWQCGDYTPRMFWADVINPTMRAVRDSINAFIRMKISDDAR